jgi:hypothetical protein
MNMPKTMAMKAIRRRGSIRSALAAAAALAAINSFPLAVGFATRAMGASLAMRLVAG